MARRLVLCLCLGFMISSAPVHAITSDYGELTRPVQPRQETSTLVVPFDHVDGQYVYASDGRRFELQSSTRILNQGNVRSKEKSAVLFFKKGKLSTVVIK